LEKSAPRDVKHSPLGLTDQRTTPEVAKSAAENVIGSADDAMAALVQGEVLQPDF